MRSGNWKYVKQNDQEYLFNLAVDIGEKNDLKIKNPQRFEQLKAAFQQWASQVLPPL